MTAKEIFLEMLKPDGKPDRLLDQYEALCLWLFDPVNGYLMNGRGPGTTRKDHWGVTISWPEDHPGQQPITTDDLKVLKDITQFYEKQINESLALDSKPSPAMASAVMGIMDSLEDL